MDKLTKAFSADISIEEGERAVVAKISTATVDRDGEVIVPDGVNWRDYQKNPVVLLGHDYYSLPIGKCTALTRDEKAITAKTIFAERPADHPAEKEWVPDTILSLFKQGVLKAFSIGFEPMDGGMRAATKGDVEKYGPECRRVFSRIKLLEYSVVTIPANQEAVALAVSKGISKETCKALFGEEPTQTHTDPHISAPIPKRVIIVVTGPDRPAKQPMNVQKVIKNTLAAKRGVVYIN